MDLLAERVYETSLATGDGDFPLLGAVQDFMSFSSVFKENQFYYTIVNRALPSEWESGIGRISGAHLIRLSILAGANNQSAVYFSNGIKDVFNAKPIDQKNSSEEKIERREFFRRFLTGR